eukprot:1994493-Pyramimonas_sp.AAC.1
MGMVDIFYSRGLKRSSNSSDECSSSTKLLLRHPPSRVLPTRAAHRYPLGEDSAYASSRQLSPLIGG